jgi:hypothetical protein
MHIREYIDAIAPARAFVPHYSVLHGIGGHSISHIHVDYIFCRMKAKYPEEGVGVDATLDS